MMSSPMDKPESPSIAPRAGADLHAARERLGWSLHDIAVSLRIRAQYLEALEAGRIDALPGNAYAIGFLRTYANALGLDANEIARRFKVEATEVNQKTELAFPAPVPERGVPAGAVVLLGIVLVVGAYVGWYRLSGEGKLPAETDTQIPVRLAPLAQQASPQVPPPPTPIAIASAPPPATPMPVDTSPLPSVSPSSAAAAPVAPLPVPPLPDDSTSTQPRILLRATADAWVQVRDRAGSVLLNRILHPGETWAVPAKPNLLLTTGNAGGTDIVVDGTSSPSLGGSGMVRRDLPLDPDLIKDGKLASPATQTAGVRLSNP